MVTYTVAALLGVAGGVVIDLFVLRTRLVRRRAFWATYPIIFLFQLLSNGILTGRDIVRYDPGAIIGVRLVHAPVEDLLFGFALVLLTLSIWVWWGRRGVQRTPAAGDGSPLLRLLDRRRVRGGEPLPPVGAGAAPSDPVRPDPARPDPVRPDPVRPDPVRPDPVRPDPA